ncbi:MAG: hypothetical protein M1299_01160 [Firmicutes bacterium]|nr:hypothetical protein [Bacillota bacterium]
MLECHEFVKGVVPDFVEFQSGGLLPLRDITGVGKKSKGGTATHVSI